MIKCTGDGKEQEEDECDGAGAGQDNGEADLEKGSVGASKMAKQNLAAENLKVFTQVYIHMSTSFLQHAMLTEHFFLFPLAAISGIHANIPC